jgi:peptide methionine sulfoxide reductase MsrB
VCRTRSEVRARTCSSILGIFKLGGTTTTTRYHIIAEQLAAAFITPLALEQKVVPKSTAFGVIHSCKLRKRRYPVARALMDEDAWPVELETTAAAYVSICGMALYLSNDKS